MITERARTELQIKSTYFSKGRIERRAGRAGLLAHTLELSYFAVVSLI
jgi:hypothetical protein